MILIEMLPRTAVSNVEDGCLRNFELARQFGILPPVQFHQANSPNIGFGQFGAGMLLSALVRISTLAHHVASVVTLCAKKKVIGIDAFAIVTAMKHAKSLRDWTMVEFIAQTMCQKNLIRYVSDHAVTRGTADGGLPLPASSVSISKFDLSYEFEN